MLMAPTLLPTPVTLKNGDGFPVAGIVFICIGGYLVIFAVVIVIRKCIIAKHGSCCPPWLAETCLCTQCCTGSDGVGCLKAIAQACNCSVPNKRQCVDAVCPSKQWCDDTLCSCMSQAPGGECCKCLNCQNCCACKDCCGECGDCANCGGCADCCDDCHCQCCAQPETISCCCIEFGTRFAMCCAETGLQCRMLLCPLTYDVDFQRSELLDGRQIQLQNAATSLSGPIEYPLAYSHYLPPLPINPWFDVPQSSGRFGVQSALGRSAYCAGVGGDNYPLMSCSSGLVGVDRSAYMVPPLPSAVARTVYPGLASFPWSNRAVPEMIRTIGSQDV